MVPYAGYSMPVKFSGLVQEHIACRKSCALYDTSHMGQYLITGRDRNAFIKWLTPVSLPEEPDNFSRLSLLTNYKGGIIDDCMVNSRKDGAIFLVVNAACRVKDDKHMRNELEKFKAEGKDVRLTWLEGRSLLALQGPKAIDVINRIGDRDLSKLKFMCSTTLAIDGIKVWASRSGYTGEDGFEIGIDKPSDAVRIAEILAEQKDVTLAGLGSRDSLRLESGLCLYGNDMNEETTPVEASLAWLIHKDRRGGDFVGGKKVCGELKNRKLAKDRRRLGLMMTGKAPPPRSHCKVLDASGKTVVGEITSGTHSPILGKGIAMAYLPARYGKLKNPKKVKIVIRNRAYPAQVCRMPFVPSKFYRD